MFSFLFKLTGFNYERNTEGEKKIQLGFQILQLELSSILHVLIWVKIWMSSFHQIKNDPLCFIQFLNMSHRSDRIMKKPQRMTVKTPGKWVTLEIVKKIQCRNPSLGS